MLDRESKFGGKEPWVWLSTGEEKVGASLEINIKPIEAAAEAKNTISLYMEQKYYIETSATCPFSP